MEQLDERPFLKNFNPIHQPNPKLCNMAESAMNLVHSKYLKPDRVNVKENIYSILFIYKLSTVNEIILYFLDYMCTYNQGQK